jgi:rhomboid family protein
MPMGLADRYYMRDRPTRFNWTLTKLLMVVLVVVFALQCINDVYLKTPAEFYLGLTPWCFTHGWVWQLITFQFLHVNFLHIACNLIGLWFFGNFVENVLGKRRFLIAYFGCGILGGLLQGILMTLFPMHFGMMVVGASAGEAGLFAIFAMLEKNTTVRFNFILPIPAWSLLWLFGLISLFFTIVPTPRESLAHAAHLGGLLAGVAWVKLGWHRDFVRLPWEALFDRWRSWKPLKARQRKRELVKAASISGPWPSRVEGQADLPEEEFISKEVDPILDKISAHGIQSLTERERKILEAARKKMAK